MEKQSFIPPRSAGGSGGDNVPRLCQRDGEPGCLPDELHKEGIA